MRAPGVPLLITRPLSTACRGLELPHVSQYKPERLEACLVGTTVAHPAEPGGAETWRGSQCPGPGVHTHTPPRQCGPEVGQHRVSTRIPTTGRVTQEPEDNPATSLARLWGGCRGMERCSWGGSAGCQGAWGPGHQCPSLGPPMYLCHLPTPVSGFDLHLMQKPNALRAPRAAETPLPQGCESGFVHTPRASITELTGGRVYKLAAPPASLYLRPRCSLLKSGYSELYPERAL